MAQKIDSPEKNMCFFRNRKNPKVKTTRVRWEKLENENILFKPSTRAAGRFFNIFIIKRFRYMCVQCTCIVYKTKVKKLIA